MVVPAKIKNLLRWNVPITENGGLPTPEFIRFFQSQTESILGALSSSRQILTGAGLAGGGDLTEDRTLVLNASLDDLTDVDTVTTPPAATNVLTYDGSFWVPGSGGGGGGGPEAAFLTSTLPGWDPRYIVLGRATLTVSNKTVQSVSGTPYNHYFGSVAHFTGKKYFEVAVGSASFSAVGICSGRGKITDFQVDNQDVFGNTAGQFGWQPSGLVRTRGGTSTVTLTTIQTWTAGDRLRVAVDLGAELIWFKVNAGNWNNSGAADPATGVGGISIGPVYSGADSKMTWPGANWGNTVASSLYLLAPDFTLSPPTGFSAWA